ncbi:hypothetical protein Cantr_06648 [Candida viswanathii]|uniref:Uncharacterized protein n=1 Tax=Candida viswanathii TaxID=5486 RepID=A0A367XWM2_9ASCO|nr:hypothetical protein Cantr_06648 [Candida viswanathii]
MNLPDNYILPGSRNTSAISTSTMSNKYSSLPKFNNHRHHHHHHHHTHPQPHSRVSSASDMHSTTGLPYNRTISSSSSIISTPSNNIKKFQRQRQQENQQYQTKTNHVPRARGNTRLVKTKLLNLQQSLKQQLINRISEEQPRQGQQHYSSDSRIQFPPHFALGKPEEKSFDCGIYTRAVERNRNELFPAVRESQIKAWESAERATRNLVFGNDSSEDESDDDEHDNAIVSIPGYTQGELSMLFKYKNLSSQEEKTLLSDYKRKFLLQQERSLTSGDSTLSYRRSLQINQKREVIAKMFNNNANNLNLEYITNNSSNVEDVLRAISMDNEELNYLLEEDGNYKLLQEEVKQNVFHKKVITNENQVDEKRNGHFDYDRFQSLTSKKLDKMHDVLVRLLEGDDSTNDEYREPSFYSDDVSNLELEEELLQFTIGYLRKCIKEGNYEDSDADE